ncbi:reverse transcriptase domain-containing protein [Tanacetum coccineum]|uniref:Reverse transcriptase domain-containing protein n=1 Tax=Tanacetum coccineum TaxID=301880 RepID=A0ABQ5IL53_9ASTR
MVTSEGNWANLKKTKAIADMQSPQNLKEMPSLSGKLAALKRFLSWSSEKSLTFFETLRDITKENKDEYRWTKSAEKAFQEMKTFIVEIPLLTTPVKEETMYVYLEAAPEAPLKQILNKAQALGKLAKYSVELGAYNITYEPRNAIKGQVLADFLSEAPGSGAGYLVLIGPSSVEFTYALRLNFSTTYNEAEYKALLAGLRMARKMKVQDINVKVDSKLVASQINGSYVASSTNKIKYLATTKECIARAIDRPKGGNCYHGEGRRQLDDAHHTLSGRRSMTGRQGGKEGPKNENKLVCLRGRCALQERVFGAHVKGCVALTSQLCHQENTHGILRDAHQGEARLGRERAGWVDELPNVLSARHTSIKQSNGETPFSLTYESEAAIPTEIGMPTHRIMMIREDKNEDELHLNIDLLQERREAAAIR